MNIFKKSLVFFIIIPYNKNNTAGIRPKDPAEFLNIRKELPMPNIKTAIASYTAFSEKVNATCSTT